MLYFARKRGIVDAGDEMNRMKPALPDEMRNGDLALESRRAAAEGDEASGFLFEGGELCDFSEKRLEFSGCSFVRCRFEEISVRWLSFSDCVFAGCDFSNASLKGAAFRRVEMRDCRAVGSEIADSWIAHALFSGCRMGYAGFGKGKLESVRFEDSDLKEASFSGCAFKAVEFDRCVLTAVEFLATPLKGVDLRTSRIDGIKLSGGELRGAVVTPEQAVELSKLLGVVVK